MKNNGRLFVISGPSGVGKGTICKQLVERNKNISVSVSATTRKPRTEDAEGVTYYFKTEAEFKQMIDDGKFLEWANYNGNYYGTPGDAVDERLSKGLDIILEIEAQGALNVMKKRPDAVSIFVVPPDTKTLYQRLKNRGSESPEEIEERLKAAEWELSQKENYDYIVVNDCLDEAIAKIENIIKDEKENI